MELLGGQRILSARMAAEAGRTYHHAGKNIRNCLLCKTHNRAKGNR